MIAVIQIFVYPEAWPDTVFWGGALLLILSRGPGAFSLDYLIERAIVTGSFRLGVVIIGLTIGAAAIVTWFLAFNSMAHAGLSCLLVTNPECEALRGTSLFARSLPYHPAFIWTGMAIAVAGLVALALSREQRRVRA
jgi:hypothetical protein